MAKDEWKSNGGRRRAISKIVLAPDKDGNPPRCWLCGGPGADTVDHVISKRARPDLVWDLGNLRPAHGSCNDSKGQGLAPAGLGSLSEEW